MQYSRNNISRSFIALSILVFSIYGCSNKNDLSGMPDVLLVGILPDENEVTLLKRYTPLFEHLSNELNVPYKIKISASYENLLEQFRKKEIHIAYFGGLTFTQASHRYNAIPIVMRDIDVRFTSYFISRVNSPAKSIPNFTNTTFCFGSKLSTSGHLMPRFFLKQKNIIPETFFSHIVYSGSHDKTAYMVRDGTVDIGVANSKIIDKMLIDGRLNQKDIQIIWETPPYPDYVWALQAGFSQATVENIRNAFLSLSPSVKEHAVILSGVDAGGFLPASSSDFSQLHEIALQTGLLN